jgi:CheY-like chemotaxis protein
VMDGFEFLQILRRNPDWQDIPVVVLTAKDLTDADRKLLFDTVEKILQKGETSRTELLREIRGIVPPAKRLT